MKLFSFIFLLIVCLTASCTGDNQQKKGEVEQFGKNKASGSTESSLPVNKDSLDSIAENKDSIIIDTTTYYGKKLNVFKDFLDLYDTIPKNKSVLFGRFSHTSSFNIFLRKKHTVQYGKSNKVFPELDVYYYEFKDSISAHNAIYNWLDCMGDCQQVKIGQDTATIKSPPLMAAFTKNEVLLLKMYCEHQANNWESIKRKSLNLLSTKPYAVMDVECGGPLKWELRDEYIRKINEDKLREGSKIQIDSL